MIPCGNVCHGHQHRTQLQQNYGQRQWPQQHLGPRCHHNSGDCKGHPDQPDYRGSTALDTLIATGWFLACWHQCDLWWQHRQQPEIQTLAAVGRGPKHGLPISKAPGDSTGNKIQLTTTEAYLLDTTIVPGGWPSKLSGVLDINTDPGCIRVMDPVMALYSSSGLHETMALGNSDGHSNWHGPGTTQPSDTNILTRLWPRTWASMWGWKQQGPLNIRTDLGFHRKTDPAIVLGSSPGPDVTMAQVQSKPPRQHGHRWWPIIQDSTYPSKVAKAIDIILGPLGCFMALDQDLALSCISGLNITLDLGHQ